MSLIGKGEELSERQTMFLLIIVVMATSALVMPGVAIGTAKRDAWIPMLLVILPAQAIIMIGAALGARFPGKTPAEYATDILGVVFGKLAVVLFLSYLLYNGAGIVRLFGEFLVLSVMPETPILVFNLMVLVLAAVAVIMGIEAVGRVNEILLPMMLLILAFIYIGVAKDMKIAQLLPVAAEGFKPLIRGTVPPTGFWGELLALSFFMPFMAEPWKAQRAGTIANLTIAVFLAAGVAEAIALFGAQVAGSQVFPLLEMAKSIQIAGFLERVESLLVALWVTGVFVKISIFLWLTAISMAGLFNIRDYRPIVLPTTSILVVLSILNYESLMQLRSFVGRLFGIYAMLFVLVLPAILLVVAVVRGKKGEGVQ